MEVKVHAALFIVCRSLKKNINDLSHKISELASRPNGGGDQQLMDQLSDELQKQHEQLVQTK
jgi:hypothetical protein